MMRRLAHLAAAVVLVRSAPARAQVNVEVYRKELKKNVVTGTIEGALDGKTGNSQGIDATADAHVAARRERHRFLVYGSTEYGKFNGTLSADKSFVHLRYGYAFAKDWLFEGFFQEQNDELQRLLHRELYGAGFRYDVYDDEVFDFAVGQYLMAETERITVAPGAHDDPDQQAIRGSTLVAATLALDDRITAAMAIYVQPKVNEPSDYRFLADGGVTFKVTDRLASKLFVTVRHDSRPPTTVFPTDTEVKSALALSF